MAIVVGTNPNKKAPEELAVIEPKIHLIQSSSGATHLADENYAATNTTNTPKVPARILSHELIKHGTAILKRVAPLELY